jgi:hypothetical protein
MTETTITGHCLCGDIQYQLNGEVVWSGYCHCESCRRFTGSVVTNWLGAKDTDLVFTKGQPTTFNTGSVTRGFCSNCGSSLTYQATHFPNYVQVHIGSLKNPNSLAPEAHVHFAEKVEWFDVADQLQRFGGSATENGNDWKETPSNNG